MDNDIKRPAAALINREWFESAAGVLNRGQLKAVVCAAVEYVLYGKEDKTLDHNSRGCKLRIRVPAWSTPGEGLLSGLQMAAFFHHAICVCTQRRGERQKICTLVPLPL